MQSKNKKMMKRITNKKDNRTRNNQNLLSMDQFHILCFIFGFFLYYPNNV